MPIDLALIQFEFPEQILAAQIRNIELDCCNCKHFTANMDRWCLRYPHEPFNDQWFIDNNISEDEKRKHPLCKIRTSLLIPHDYATY